MVEPVDPVMGRALRPGEEVDWNTPQGVTHGKVVEKITRPARIKGHKVAASKDEPEYLVQSAKTGKRAAHKRSALKKR